MKSGCLRVGNYSDALFFIYTLFVQLPIFTVQSTFQI